MCKNDYRASRKLVEERCLAGLKDELLTPETVERIIQNVTRLLVARNRERQPELERTQRQLAKVESEIGNIMKAIKAGIFTSSTKAELEQGEAEQGKLQEAIKRRETNADKVTTLLPGAQERIREVVNNLASLSQKHVMQAREQLQELIGQIRLVPKAEGYLEAVLQARNEGVVKLAVGRQLNNLVAGRGFEPLTFGL